MATLISWILSRINTDLEALFSLLMEFKDCMGRYAVMTPVVECCQPGFF